jgi:uncharacterized protein (TIGR03032 family)
MSTAPEAPWLEVTASRDFVPWLARHNVSLAFTTYQACKLFFLGRNAAGTLSVFERTFNRCMGLHGDGQTLWMSSLFQLWRFENVLRPGELHEGYDRLFGPRVEYTTGDLDSRACISRAIPTSAPIRPVKSCRTSSATREASRPSRSGSSDTDA